MKHVVVIGGGLTGLAAAWKIQQSIQQSPSPVGLLLLEGSPQVGGFLRTFKREGFVMEMGADCFISDKPRGVGLCRELGLESELIGTRPDKRRSFILRDGIFYPVPEGFYLMGPTRRRPFLESKLLSWPGKLRALCEPLIPKRQTTDESLGSFVRRRFGRELLDWMAQPLVAGIYGADPEQLSLRATFPKFLEMEREYGSVLLGLRKRQVVRRATSDVGPRKLDALNEASGARYSLFVTPRHGMQALPDALAAKLGAAVLQTQTRVKSVRRADGGWQVVKANGEILTADAVCIALPSFAAADLVRTLDADLAAELDGISDAPSATVNLAFRERDVKRPLDGVGFVVPIKENRLVLGCTFVQNKFEGRVPKGFILMRAFLGGTNARWLEEKDENLVNQVYSDLQDWFGITDKTMFTHLQRYERSLPQFAVGHVERILRIEERLFRHPGLALAGNWQYGVGVPDCIESGERAAVSLLKQLTPSPA